MSNTTENELLEAVAKMHGLSVTEYLMRRAVPDSLMRDIVMDNRRGISNSASMIPDHERNKPVARGTGWVDPAPIRPPPGAEPGGAIDRMVEADTRRQREEAELERQKKTLDRVKIQMEVYAQQRAFEEELRRRDEELDPTGQLYGPYDDDDK
jgi:hypothetical protein